MSRSTFLVGWHNGQELHAHELLESDHEAVAELVKLVRDAARQFLALEEFQRGCCGGPTLCSALSKPAG